MKSLNENNLKEALHLYAKKMADGLPTDEEISDIEFSPEFEQRMKCIIKSRKKPLLRCFNTTVKRVASIAVIFIILFSVTFSVKALREPFIEMIETIFSNHIEIQFDGDKKDCITEIYELKQIPDGFELTDEIINETMVYCEYTDENGIVLDYKQMSTANNGGIYIDNEHSTHYTLTVDGKKIYIFNWKERNAILVFWVENGYAFSIHYYATDISDDEIIAMIKSNTIKEYIE